MAEAVSGGAVRALVALAALAGAAGVTLAAVAAHSVDSPSLATAASMLMIHSAAVVAIVAAARWFSNPRMLMMAGAIMLVGAVLFSGAIAMGVLAGVSLPMVAPAGGVTLIAAWLLTALAAVLSRPHNGG